jgi:hypothetical protein
MGSSRWQRAPVRPEFLIRTQCHGDDQVLVEVEDTGGGTDPAALSFELHKMNAS